MSTPLLVNGVTYLYPDTGDQSWGTVASAWAAAMTSGTLQKAGGAFTLTADANFGANFGLVSKYFTSRTANAASSGVFRLANGDGIGFRDSGNTADYLLKPSTNGFLQYNSVDLVNLSGGQTLSGKSMSGSTNTFSNIPFSSLASLPAGQMIVGNGSNVATAVLISGDLRMGNNGSALVNSIAGVNVGFPTGTGNVVMSASPTLSGTVAGSFSISGAITFSASGFALTVTNNASINNVVFGAALTASSAGTTTLTVSSKFIQQITGSTTQTVELPDATTLTVGHSFWIRNRSSGAVTLNANGGGLVQTLAANSQTLVTCTANGTSAGTWDSQYSLNNAQVGTVTSVTFTGDGTVLSSTPSSAVTGSGTVSASLNTQPKNTILAGPVSGSNATPTFRAQVYADLLPALKAPTVQAFTASSGTYTTPTSPSPLYIRVRVLGGGGGGGGSSTAGDGASGAGGGSSTFGTILTAFGGSGAAGFADVSGGLGGAATIGAGATGIISTGSGGAPGVTLKAVGIMNGGSGGASALGGGGRGSGAANGGSATLNTGGGGGGGAVSGGFGTSQVYGGGGGGAGGFVDAVIVSPASTYAYAVGSAGAGGAAGTGGSNGGSGGSGIIIVEEFYQ